MAGEAALAVAQCTRSAWGSILAGVGPGGGGGGGDRRAEGDLKVRLGTEANTFT